MLKQRAAHWGWLWRRRRAAIADALERPFTFPHPVLGRFVYHPNDDISRAILLYQLEEAELAFAMRHAARGGTIVDVGANVGLFTVACARAAGSSGRVLALEPSPATFEKLRLTCGRLGLENVELLPVAAAAAGGPRSFVSRGLDPQRQHLADGRDARPGDTVTVDARALDDLLGERAASVSVLKVDVEGHEVEVLRGAGRVLHNGAAALIVECYPAGLEAAGASCDELWALLQRTHDCVGVVRRNGATVAGTRASLAPPAGDETVNTLWLPRPRPA